MGEGKSLAAFMDATFAEDDGLASAGEGIADDLPFFEADCLHLLLTEEMG